jgi:hypothetical protein
MKGKSPRKHYGHREKLIDSWCFLFLFVDQPNDLSFYNDGACQGQSSLLVIPSFFRVQLQNLGTM